MSIELTKTDVTALASQALSFLQNLEDADDAQTFLNLFIKSLNNSGVSSSDLLLLFNEVNEIDNRICFSIEIFGILDGKTQYSIENERSEGETLKDYLEGGWFGDVEPYEFEFKGLTIFVSKEAKNSEDVEFSMSDNQKTERFN